MPADAAWIETQSTTALTRLTESWPHNLPPLPNLIATFPLGEPTLRHLLAYSPITLEKLLRDPEALLWLSEPGICDADRSLWQMEVDLARLRGDQDDAPPPFDEHVTSLRRQKSRELIRIALRETSRAVPIEQSAEEISLIAELCLTEIYEGWHRQLSSRWGVPEAHLCILGMGKLGGGELNFSSDIDLIYFYSSEGELKANLTYQQYFTRLAEKINATFSASHEAGNLFRIDLRLRPDGKSGPLVRSLDSMEHYYAAYGETWERMALLKARPVVGDPELGYEFLRRLHPFIYPRHLATETLQEIASLKHRIDTELVTPEDHEREIKRGRGGIREIEFIAQSLQLLHAARHPFLQQKNTLKTLDALNSMGDPALLSAEDAETLASAYRSLRTLEHRLMIAEEKQTHLLPGDPEALDRLSSSLGFATTDAFQVAHRNVTSRVHALFDAQFNDLSEPPAIAHDLSCFRDPQEAAKEIARLGGEASASTLTPRARRVFQGLKPSFLRSLGYAAEPDLVLTRYSRFIENYGIRAILYETLIQHPRLIELLTKLFDASASVSEIAIRRPELVDEIARSGGIEHRHEIAHYLELLTIEDIPPGDPLRRFRSAQLFRIALRDVLELASLDDILLEYTALAEACLRHTLRRIDPDEALTIVAMGKFGARELSYGSDLDIVFLGDHLEPARELLAEYNRISEEGPLDEIDPRLRPEGRSGPLVCGLGAYESYFEKRADLWEAQALTKARVLRGAASEATKQIISQIWTRNAQRPDLVPEIRAMLERIHKKRASYDDSLDFKTGHGGMIAIEFAIQAHQMKTNLPETNTLKAAHQLAETGLIPGEAAADLTRAYTFLRRIAFTLRRLENRSLSSIPKDPHAQKALARRLGYKSPQTFQEDLHRHRQNATQAVDQLLSE